MELSGVLAICVILYAALRVLVVRKLKERIKTLDEARQQEPLQLKMALASVVMIQGLLLCGAMVYGSTLFAVRGIGFLPERMQDASAEQVAAALQSMREWIPWLSGVKEGYTTALLIISALLLVYIAARNQLLHDAETVAEAARVNQEIQQLRQEHRQLRNAPASKEVRVKLEHLEEQFRQLKERRRQFAMSPTAPERPRGWRKLAAMLLSEGAFSILRQGQKVWVILLGVAYAVGMVGSQAPRVSTRLEHTVPVLDGLRVEKNAQIARQRALQALPPESPAPAPLSSATEAGIDRLSRALARGLEASLTGDREEDSERYHPLFTRNFIIHEAYGYPKGHEPPPPPEPRPPTEPGGDGGGGNRPPAPSRGPAGGGSTGEDKPADAIVLAPPRPLPVLTEEQVLMEDALERGPLVRQLQGMIREKARKSPAFVRFLESFSEPVQPKTVISTMAGELLGKAMAGIVHDAVVDMNLPKGIATEHARQQLKSAAKRYAEYAVDRLFAESLAVASSGPKPGEPAVARGPLITPVSQDSVRNALTGQEIVLLRSAILQRHQAFSATVRDLGAWHIKNSGEAGSEVRELLHSLGNDGAPLTTYEDLYPHGSETELMKYREARMNSLVEQAVRELPAAQRKLARQRIPAFLESWKQQEAGTRDALMKVAVNTQLASSHKGTGGIVIGNAPTSGTVEVVDIDIEKSHDERKLRFRLLLADGQWRETPWFHVSLVPAALQYVADRRVVAVTITSSPPLKEKQIHLHPALLSTAIGCQLIRADQVTFHALGAAPEGTGGEYSGLRSTAYEEYGLYLLVREAVSAYKEERDPAPLQASSVTGLRPFSGPRALAANSVLRTKGPFNEVLVAVVDVCLEKAEDLKAFQSCASRLVKKHDLREVPPLPAMGTRSGVRETAFRLEPSLSAFSDEEPYRFLVQEAFDMQKGELFPAWEYPLTGAGVDQLVKNARSADPGLKETLGYVREFILLQRLFRAAVDQHLGASFPLHKLVALASIKAKSVPTPRWEKTPEKYEDPRPVAESLLEQAQSANLPDLAGELQSCMAALDAGNFSDPGLKKACALSPQPRAPPIQGQISELRRRIDLLRLRALLGAEDAVESPECPAL